MTMKTRFIGSDAKSACLMDAAHIIRSGGLVVFPTETVYGLGGDATNAESAKKIYAAKGRPSDNPLIIHIDRPESAEPYAVTNEYYYRLAEKFMPGPLTVILPRKDTIPKETAGGLDTVAVRCPSHPIAHAFIEACGVPVAAPSANLSGKPSPTNAADVLADMDGRVDMIIDGGDSEIGLESTIVKLDGDCGILLRPGAVTVDALRCVLREVKVDPAVTGSLPADAHPLSPGMKYRHYSPDTPLVLLDGNDSDVLEFMKKTSDDAILICFDDEAAVLAGHRIIPVGSREDLSEEAHRLFSALRMADRMGAKVIYGHLPKKNGIGLALYNRMIRAAAHTVRKV